MKNERKAAFNPIVHRPIFVLKSSF